MNIVLAEHLTEVVTQKKMDRSKPVFIEIKEASELIRVPLTPEMFREETNDIVITVDCK